MRAQGYLAGSLIAAAVVVWHAFMTREQFFPAMVHLSSSKLSVAILGNLGLALSFVVYKTLTWAFLGRLRDFEIERINDRLGQAVVETLLAMTIFRQEFTVGFLAQFTILSLIKIFHWIAQDRVAYIETTPNISRAQHLRLFTFLHFLLGADYFALHYALQKTISHGVSVHLLFAFEYAVQLSTAAATILKYAFSIIDVQLQGRWEGKGVAVFYLELTLDLLHLITYSIFFAVVFSTYGIPIHLVRDLYWTFRNFQTRVRDFLRYRRIAANMERRFPDATPEDLDRADHVCIVCREEMGPGSRAKKLDCSHVFHMHCLRSWLERQQNCPICRAPVVVGMSSSSSSHIHRNDGGNINGGNGVGVGVGGDNNRDDNNDGVNNNNNINGGGDNNQNNNNININPRVFIQHLDQQPPQPQPIQSPLNNQQQQQHNGIPTPDGQHHQSPFTTTTTTIHPSPSPVQLHNGIQYVQVVHVPVMVPILTSPHAMHAMNVTPGSSTGIPTPEQHAIASQVAAAAAAAAVASASPVNNTMSNITTTTPVMMMGGYQQQPGVVGMMPFGSPIQSPSLHTTTTQQQQEQQQQQPGVDNNTTATAAQEGSGNNSVDEGIVSNQPLSTRFEQQQEEREEQQEQVAVEDDDEASDLRRRRLQRFEQQQQQQ